jgi:REP element-mobilizing transposase RayT
MTNHYHLVVDTELWRLSDGMHRLNGTYALAFNRRHRRSGHLFGERYGAWVPRSGSHLRATIEYVRQNPVRAGLCPVAADWPWSAAEGA